MKVSLLILFLAAIITDPARIGKINRAKDEAKKAYQAGDYQTAVSKYQYLKDSLGVNEDEVLLNLANAYFELNDTTAALQHYQQLTQSSNGKIKSLAQQQLGVTRNRQAKFEDALNHFKEAIKADPTNMDARYNYELLKRKLDEQKKQDQQQNQDKDQQKDDKQDQQKKDDQKKEQEKKEQDKQDKKDESGKPDDQKKDEKQEQQQQEQSGKEDEKKENQPSSEKLQQMKISQEAANKILEAMRNQEVQYLQQNKRKATQPKDKNKPDW
ncbi:MAG: tetratricopeptide repeat protein [Cyclobacteriaceae bacterium]|nr:tetratricopeptide repeat protein [Cyclobacteriaceae bacterium]